MASSRFKFTKFYTDSVVFTTPANTIATDGGMVTAGASGAITACCKQSISGDKQEKFAQLNIIATHVFFFAPDSVARTLAVGTTMTDSSGAVFEVVYFEFQGGEKNPIGKVFCVYGRELLNR